MKVSIKFSLAKTKSADYPIRIRVSYDGQRLDMRSGYVCPESCWDTSTMRMIPGTKNRYGESASLINAKLSKQEADINTILTKYELEGKSPDPQLLKQDFESVQGRARKPTDSRNIADIMDLWLKENAKRYETSSLRNYILLQSRFKHMDISSKDIEELSPEDIDRFVWDLVDDELQNGTIQVYVRIIKTILRWAHKTKLYKGSLYEEYDIDLKQIKKDVMYLEWDEFKALYNLNLFKKSHISARDMFCFCCSTGLRFSDCLKLTWNEVNLSDEKPYINIVAKKTKKVTRIELNNYSKAIILRQDNTRKNVFPSFDLRIRQDILSVISRMAGLTRKVRKLKITGHKITEEYKEIWEVISSHWGRHTFVVHALSLGISPTVVMSWTGHSSYDAMKPYIAIASKEKEENMSKFND